MTPRTEDHRARRSVGSAETSVGRAMRQARRRRGLKRSEVARQARIPARYIAALEEDDLGALPEGTFRSTYRRQYMAFLGMPPLYEDIDDEAVPEVFVDEPDMEFSASTATIPRGEEIPVGRLVITGFALTLVTVLALKVGSLLVDSESFVEVGSAPVAAAMSSVVPTEAPAKTGPAAAPPEEAADEPAAAAALPGQVVRVRAIEPVRIQAWAGDTLTHRGMLRAGKVLELQSEETIAVAIGDLTRVRLSLDGERIEPLHNLSNRRRLVFVPTTDRD
jgi:cytoskeletal protein RodZ